jgi:hypothetical protein
MAVVSAIAAEGVDSHLAPAARKEEEVQSSERARQREIAA